MQKSSLSLFLACAIFLSGCSVSSPLASLPWSYHENGYEIYEPQISRDNSHIVFTRKRYIPDGHDAEMFSEGELRQIDDQIRADARFADPEVVVVDLAGKSMLRVDYGWSPFFSGDRKKILYAHQKNPISGLRVLAATLAGNEIREYDLVKRKNLTIAEPSLDAVDEYYSNPVYDGKGVPFFSISGPVNGAWGGDIGVASIDPATGKLKILYSPEKEYGLYHIVPKFLVRDGTCLIQRNRPTTPGVHIADRYMYDLVNAESGTVVYSWGEHPVQSVKTDFRECPSGIEVYDGLWMALSASRSESGMENSQPLGISSPNCSTVAVVNKRKTVTIVPAGGKSARTWQAGTGVIQSLTWSPDSTLIALVITKRGEYHGKFEYDELFVVRVDDLPLCE